MAAVALNLGACGAMGCCGGRATSSLRHESDLIARAHNATIFSYAAWCSFGVMANERWRYEAASAWICLMASC